MSVIINGNNNTRLQLLSSFWKWESRIKRRIDFSLQVSFVEKNQLGTNSGASNVEIALSMLILRAKTWLNDIPVRIIEKSRNCEHFQDCSNQKFYIAVRSDNNIMLLLVMNIDAIIWPQIPALVDLSNVSRFFFNNDRETSFPFYSENGFARKVKF